MTGAVARCLYLVPDLFSGSGGIARYGCLVIKALTESGLVPNMTILCLCDPASTQLDPRYAHGANVRYRAFGGDRLAFGRAAIGAQLRNRYDLLLAGHVNLAPLMFLPLGLRHTRPPRVTFIYGTDAWDRLPWFRRRCLAASRAVIAISKFTATTAAEANDMRTDAVRVLHNCLDPMQFVNSPESAIEKLTPRRNAFVTVARMSRSEIGKGHRTVINALPLVLQRIPDAEYWIVGEGDLRPDLERHASEVGVADRVRFMGRVSDRELENIYRQCKAFVMPSKSEGFGFAFLEAMAKDLPIIAGNVDASPEVVGDAGIIVDPDDAHQVATAITRLLDDADLRRRLTQQARFRLESRYSYPRFRSTLVSYVSELLQTERTTVAQWV